MGGRGEGHGREREGHGKERGGAWEEGAWEGRGCERGGKWSYIYMSVVHVLGSKKFMEEEGRGGEGRRGTIREKKRGDVLLYNTCADLKKKKKPCVRTYEYRGNVIALHVHCIYPHSFMCAGYNTLTHLTHTTHTFWL